MVFLLPRSPHSPVTEKSKGIYLESEDTQPQSPRNSTFFPFIFNPATPNPPKIP